jgi:hypothetical protein
MHRIGGTSATCWCPRCGTLCPGDETGLDRDFVPRITCQLLPAFVAMRDAQISYFRRNRYSDLQAAKHKEAEVDRLLGDYRKLGPAQQQETLF